MFAIRRGEIVAGGVHGRVEMSDARKDASNAAADAESGRLPAIDILRGLAIFWVILFHLWGDIKFFPGAPSGYYEAFHDRLSGDGTTYHLFTAFTDIAFRDGFQGVPLFMMISGISLTIAAYRAGDALRWPRFFLHRFRKLMVPYWAGVAITYGLMAAIAWRQISIGDGSFSDHFTRGVSISLLSRIEIDRQVVFASIALWAADIPDPEQRANRTRAAVTLDSAYREAPGLTLSAGTSEVMLQIVAAAFDSIGQEKR